MEAPVRPGDVLLGKYHVERVLGQGGMGVVVAARHLELGELFAIKFLLPEALKSSDAVDRFLREARASARLKGEHVVKVHDVGRLDTGAPYMVMEHLDGSDLKAVLRARGPLAAEEAATLLLQVCDALAEAHRAGIIHRDLKPANLFLIRRPNGTPCVKVLDFGISRQISPEAVDLTKSGMMMGSPLYMSPEQMRRTKSADARSDVWSLGVVLYELVTGQGPFAAETLMEVFARVIQEEPLPPSQVRVGLHPAIDGIVGRCLQKDPEHRFQSIDELMAALQAVAGIRVSSPSLVPSLATASLIENEPPPDAQMLRAPPRDSTPSPASRPDAAPIRSSDPSAAPARASLTGSVWNQTGARGRPSLGPGKVGFVVAAVTTGIALGGVSVWVLSKPSSSAVPASQAIDTAAPLAATVATMTVGDPSPPAPNAAVVTPADSAARSSEPLASARVDTSKKAAATGSSAKPKGSTPGPGPTAAPKAAAVTPSTEAAPLLTTANPPKKKVSLF